MPEPVDAKRFVIEGTKVDFVVRNTGQVSFYLQGKWCGTGLIPVTVKRWLLEGVAPEGTGFNGTHST